MSVLPMIKKIGLLRFFIGFNKNISFDLKMKSREKFLNRYIKV